jgi:hypothetical protein
MEAQPDLPAIGVLIVPTNQPPVRQMAERIRRIAHDVLESFQLDDPAARVAKLEHVEAEILADTLPVIDWLERKRPPDKAALVKRRLEFVLREAVHCAGLEIPEYAGGTVARVAGEPSWGAARTAELSVTAGAFAASLRGWADDLERENNPAVDESAYVALSKLLDAARFKTPKRIHAALKKNPWIRTYKPSKQRFMIHAGDWHRYVAMLDEAGFNALDVGAETAEAFLAEVNLRRVETGRHQVG